MSNPAGQNPIIDFLPYQKAWINDASRFKIGLMARQVGKTFGSCGEIVKDCIDAEMAGRRTRWVILSRGERQAKETIDAGVKPISQAFYALYTAQLQKQPTFYEGQWRASSGAEYRALEVEFPGGSRITGVPANPDTARGFSANMLLDEFAFHQDSRKIWTAAFPIISKAGLKMRVISTTNGKGNKFYELWSSTDDVWSKHRCTIHDAARQGLDRDLGMLRTAINDEDAWEQEYECTFVDAASAWLPFDMIAAVEHGEAGKPEHFAGGQVYIGNDIAVRGDLWVAWVWELLGDIFWTREIVELRRASFAAQDAVINGLMEKYPNARLAMDQTGMGEKPVEDAIRRYGSGRVEGVVFTAARKLDMATNAKQLFEDRRGRIPAGNPALRADLHKLQKVVGPTGHPRLVANRDSAGHADRTWAGFLGLALGAFGHVAPAGMTVDPIHPRDAEPDGSGLYVPDRLLMRPVPDFNPKGRLYGYG